MSEPREAQREEVRKGMLEALGGRWGQARLINFKSLERNFKNLSKGSLKKDLLGKGGKLHWRPPEAPSR